MRNGGAKYLFFGLTVALAMPLLLGSCKNDLKKIEEISALQKKTEQDSTKGVNMLYSDSGKVKARLITPLMLEYVLSAKTPDPYQYCPKGIKIIMYDKNRNEQGTIIADTCYYYTVKKKVEFYKNVVITTITGDVFKSEELIWDQALNKIYSRKEVDVVKADGSKGHGTSMETNQTFYPFTVQQGTGNWIIDREFGQ
ncbi:LPS export ABC transporter periplasmic protein LptC [Mucilaginibacter myungsuensis]|uniref:LPS export ABC transporter periplasmic protein LptC n=1 Tax=Mucilaginibacter myungsuensis TaxID=649104 RepID=A0A929PWR1_9SPHI|nr:LPS export ABC transporter periplasmic protein LptC [Mucilaginibacter myungsuensis]MBE9661447.1 LPS export ABC transporter periplasmic protein LptC [Mucilaginibacter myungsuensis]MDN3597590.1 LPS export ABC transporter periplasmic protein LptC [Mucilaginibacter myungsuensis]